MISIKLIRLFFLLCLVSTSSIGQTYILDVNPNGFESGSSITDIREMENGNSLFLCRKNGAYALVEMTVAGQVLRTDSLDGNSHNWLDHTFPLENGSLLHYGFTGYTKRAAFVLRDSNRNIVKDTFLRESSWSGALTYVYDATMDKDGNIYFVGNVYDIYSGGSVFYSWNIPFIGKLNSNLQLQWTKTFSTHNSSNRRSGRANSITFDADSNLVVFGSHSHRYPNTAARDYLVKFSNNGSTIWSRENLAGNGNGVTAPIRAITDQYGNIYTLKSLYESSAPNGRKSFQVDKFNSNGSRIWSKAVGHGTSHVYPTDIGINSVGSVIISGRVALSPMKGMIVVMDSSGAITSSSGITVNSSANTLINSMRIMSDDYILLGASDNSDQFLVRANPSGFTSCNSDTMVMELDTMSTSWNSGVSLSSKSLLYYPVTLSSNHLSGSDIDTLCFTAPSCDVVGAFSMNDSILCQEESLTLGNTSTGTGLSIQWSINGSVVAAGNSFDSLLASGSYTIAQYTTGAYCNDTVTKSVLVLQTQFDSMSLQGCANDSIVVNGHSYYSDTIIVESYSNAIGCDSIITYTLDFIDLYTVLSDTICSTDSFNFGSKTLHQSGTYFDTLVGYFSCDSIVELQLTVLPAASTILSDSICAGDTLAFNGQNLTASGVYTHSETAANGCDSTVTLTLMVLSHSYTSLSESICNGDTFNFNGQLLTSAGTYTHTEDAANGCDSTVTLTLTVLLPSTELLYDTFCAGDTLNFNGQNLTTTGSYFHIEQGANGCDSTTTMMLTVLPNSTISIAADLCFGDTYAFNGQSITATGSHVYASIAANGCDSTTTLELVVLNHSYTSLSESICNGDTFNFNGQLLTSAGTYTHTEDAANGCDSTVTLTLTVLLPSTELLYDTICAGDTLNFNGQNLTTTGSYFHIEQGANGCDSTTTMMLTVLPNSTTSVAADLCFGDTYAFNGSLLTTAGVYTYSTASANGCDSTMTLDLTLLPLAFDTIPLEICAGDSATFNGQIYGESGLYSFTAQAANGCDSTSTLQLTVMPFLSTEINASICAGDTYLFYGQELTETGLYTHVEVANNGCDSTITLNLTKLPNATAASERQLCRGEQFVFGSQTITEAGVYSAVFNAANNCDSTHTLTVTLSTITSKVGIYGDSLKSIFPAHIYEWVACPLYELTGIYTPYFTPNDDGFYALIAYDSNLCSDTSDCFQVTTNSVDHKTQATFKPYPNPAQAWIHIDPSATYLQADWYDALGRLVLHNSATNGRLNTPTTSGFYVLKLTSTLGVDYHNIVVMRR